MGMISLLNLTCSSNLQFLKRRLEAQRNYIKVLWIRDLQRLKPFQEILRQWRLITLPHFRSDNWRETWWHVLRAAKCINIACHNVSVPTDAADESHHPILQTTLPICTILSVSLSPVKKDGFFIFILPLPQESQPLCQITVNFYWELLEGRQLPMWW